MALSNLLPVSVLLHLGEAGLSRVFMELQILKALKRQRPLCSRDGKALLVGSLHIAL